MKKIQKNMTLDEVEQDVFRRIKRGENYSEIVKTRYEIDGTVKKYNPGQISKIKKKFTGEVDDSKNKDPNAAILFKLFEDGESLCDIVVKTQLSPDYVQEMFDKFCEMKKMTVLPSVFINSVSEYAKWVKGREVNGLNEVQRCLEVAVMHYLEPSSENLCEACENPEEW
jgi:hypothetical protein